jgi:ribose 5-phosphate isomerase B
MIVYLAADHAGFELKGRIREHLMQRGIPVEDLGSHSAESVNYAEFGAAVAARVSVDPENSRGILICGTGIGMAMVANKFPGVRAAVCHDEFTARVSRSHNNANVLSLGGRVVSVELGLRLVDIFLDTPFEGGRHLERLSFIAGKVEKNNFR